MPSIEAPKEDWDKVIQACAMGSTERSQTCDRRRAICSASGWGPSRQQEMGRVKSGASGRGDAVGSLQQEMRAREVGASETRAAAGTAPAHASQSSAARNCVIA